MLKLFYSSTKRSGIFCSWQLDHEPSSTTTILVNPTRGSTAVHVCWCMARMTNLVQSKLRTGLDWTEYTTFHSIPMFQWGVWSCWKVIQYDFIAMQISRGNPVCASMRKSCMCQYDQRLWPEIITKLRNEFGETPDLKREMVEIFKPRQLKGLWEIRARDRQTDRQADRRAAVLWTR